MATPKVLSSFCWSTLLKLGRLMWTIFQWKSVIWRCPLQRNFYTFFCFVLFFSNMFKIQLTAVWLEKIENRKSCKGLWRHWTDRTGLLFLLVEDPFKYHTNTCITVSIKAKLKGFGLSTVPVLQHLREARWATKVLGKLRTKMYGLFLVVCPDKLVGSVLV